MDDAANDVWSLGVMLFQMLACTVPGPQVGQRFSIPIPSPSPTHATKYMLSWLVQLLGRKRACLRFQLAQSYE